MQKLKNSVLQKMIESRLTSNEFDFLLYVSRFQDDAGTASGIHYKEVCEAMGISHQGFYDVKNALMEKGIIKSGKSNRIDHDITILGNEFLDESDLKSGYVNTNHNIFFQKSFYKLKAGAKLLAMELMKCSYAGTGQYKIGTKKFYDKYTKLFQASKRVMRGYLMSLKEFFSIGIVDGMYYIRPKTNVYVTAGQASERDNLNAHNVEVICRRNRIREADKKAKKDVATLINQYRKKASFLKGEITDLLNQAVLKSLEILNRGSDKLKIRKLRPKLIHIALKELLA